MTDDRFPHPNTAESDLIQSLRDSPKPYSDLPYPPKPHHRKYVGKLHFSGSGKSRGGQVDTIYFLYGDERRAIRVFIRENEPFVRECMSDESNPLARQMSDDAWSIMCEEWRWMQTDS